MFNNMFVVPLSFEEILLNSIEAKCNSCGFAGTLDDFDVAGACPDNLFCNECGVEFVSETGDPALLCGNCFGCECLVENGEFESTQQDRVEQIKSMKNSKG